MGKFGYGYRDSDNYFNEVASFVEPLTKALDQALLDVLDGGGSYGTIQAYVNEIGDTPLIETGDLDLDAIVHDFRPRLIWTVNALKGAEALGENTPLTEDGLTVLNLSVTVLRGIAAKFDEEDVKWRDAITTEMDMVQAWLDGFGETGEGGFLADRIGPLMAAMDARPSDPAAWEPTIRIEIKRDEDSGVVEVSTHTVEFKGADPTQKSEG